MTNQDKDPLYVEPVTTQVAVREQSTDVAAVPEDNMVSMMQVINRAASDPNTDVDKMERLMAMYERMESKKAEMAFSQALTACQTEMRTIGADKQNNQTSSRYASYDKLDKVLRPIYTSHGFSLSFNTGEAKNPEEVRVLCRVSHSAGHSELYKADMPADGKGAKGGAVMTKTHATGAAMSYGMRYLLKMIFNVAIGEEDTDGNMPVEKVSEEQAADIEALIEEVASAKGVEVAKYRSRFLGYMMAKTVADIQAADYDRAVSELEKKRSEV